MGLLEAAGRVTAGRALLGETDLLATAPAALAASAAAGWP